MVYDHSLEGSQKWFNNRLNGWAFQMKKEAKGKVQAAANDSEAEKALAKSNLENLEEKKKLIDEGVMMFREKGTKVYLEPPW